MPAVRSILLRLDVREAGKRCKCANNAAHVIAKGEARFVVSDRTMASSEKGYCAACAAAMIDKARADLQALERDLRAKAS
jgi:predicted lipoprotein